MSNGLSKRNVGYPITNARREAWEKVWVKRDQDVQKLFDRITYWLRLHPGEYNTAYYDSLVAQWLEFAAVTATQKKELETMIERHGIP